MIAFDETELEGPETAARRAGPKQSTTISIGVAQAVHAHPGASRDKQPFFRVAIAAIFANPAMEGNEN
jgi:hypothetical protein